MEMYWTSEFANKWSKSIIYTKLYINERGTHIIEKREENVWNGVRHNLTHLVYEKFTYNLEILRKCFL